ncbi:hypothetical protein [Streptosporangium roseum]|uniref:hypothetical protein n=1 Tax=Streptosporangium roseum TaxID=2001 RepID=UPI0018CC5D27|nr:hypothetical protein [Streptosporangium roseum]
MDVIARRAGNMARRREKAWRWEHWGVVPDRETQLALAAELGIREDLLDAQPWPERLPVGDPIRADFSWDQPGSMLALDQAVGNAMMDRRGFMRLTGVGLAGFAADWLNIDTAELMSVLGGGRITEDFVAQIEAGVPRLRMLGEAYGGQRSRRLIDAELGMVVEVLEKSSYSVAVAQRLHGLAAELGRLAGYISFDAGLHSAAQRYWVAAVHSAHTAGDRALGANILKSMALQCYDFGNFSGFLTIARTAYEGAGNVTPRTAGMLAVRLARAYASVDDVAESQRLLGIADTHFGQGTCDDDPPWIGYFDEGEFHAQAGMCYLDLGNLHRADSHLDNALERFFATKPLDQTTYLVMRARVQNDLGNADQAGDLLHQAVSLIEQAPSQRNVDRLVAVRNYLPDNTSRSDLDQRLSTLTG